MAKRSKKFKLTVLGKNCDFSKKVVEIATPIILKKMISTRMLNTITLRIELRSTTIQKGCWGTANNNLNGSAVDRNYRIKIQRDLGIDVAIKTLIHELAHVVQYATNRLQHRYWKSDKQLHVRWEGTEMGVKANIKYWTSPWEVEARELSEKHLKAVKREVLKVLGFSSLDYAGSKYAQERCA